MNKRAAHLVLPTFMVYMTFYGCSFFNGTDTGSNDTQPNRCRDEETLAKQYRAQAQKYQDKSQPFSKEDAVSLVRTAMYGLPKEIVRAGCEMHSSDALSSARSVLDVRQSDIIKALNDVACHPQNCADTDFSCMNYRGDRLRVAVNGLKYMHAPAAVCDGGSANH